jgi:hypothetical protein
VLHLARANRWCLLLVAEDASPPRGLAARLADGGVGAFVYALPPGAGGRELALLILASWPEVMRRSEETPRPFVFWCSAGGMVLRCDTQTPQAARGRRVALAGGTGLETEEGR